MRPGTSAIFCFYRQLSIWFWHWPWSQESDEAWTSTGIWDSVSTSRRTGAHLPGAGYSSVAPILRDDPQQPAEGLGTEACKWLVHGNYYGMGHNRLERNHARNILKENEHVLTSSTPRQGSSGPAQQDVVVLWGWDREEVSGYQRSQQCRGQSCQPNASYLGNHPPQSSIN